MHSYELALMNPWEKLFESAHVMSRPAVNKKLKKTLQTVTTRFTTKVSFCILNCSEYMTGPQNYAI